MSKGLIRSLSRGIPLAQQITKKTIVLDGKTMIMTGATGVGWGTVVLEGLPEANILILGLVLDATFTDSEAAAGDISSAVFNSDVALGTVPGDDATPTGAQVDILASTSVAAATASVASARVPLATAALLDNTAGTGEINLTFLIDDAEIGGDTAVINLGGSLHIVYITLGDD